MSNLIPDETENYTYEKGDAACATVTSHCSKGAFLLLDDGERGFCYQAGNLPVNSKIICSIVRPADNGHSCLVRLDSVCSYNGYEAA